MLKVIILFLFSFQSYSISHADLTQSLVGSLNVKAVDLLELDNAELEGFYTSTKDINESEAKNKSSHLKNVRKSLKAYIQTKRNRKNDVKLFKKIVKQTLKENYKDATSLEENFLNKIEKSGLKLGLFANECEINIAEAFIYVIGHSMNYCNGRKYGQEYTVSNFLFGYGAALNMDVDGTMGGFTACLLDNKSRTMYNVGVKASAALHFGLTAETHIGMNGVCFGVRSLAGGYGAYVAGSVMTMTYDDFSSNDDDDN